MLLSLAVSISSTKLWESCLSRMSIWSLSVPIFRVLQYPVLSNHCWTHSMLYRLVLFAGETMKYMSGFSFCNHMVEVLHPRHLHIRLLLSFLDVHLFVNANIERLSRLSLSLVCSNCSPVSSMFHI